MWKLLDGVELPEVSTCNMQVVDIRGRVEFHSENFDDTTRNSACGPKSQVRHGKFIIKDLVSP